MTDDPDYVIWSNEHRNWWGPNRCGYVRFLREAGRYSRGQAIEIVRQAQYGRQNMTNQIPPEIMVRLEDAEATLQW